jgi:hypothetical protein
LLDFVIDNMFVQSSGRVFQERLIFQLEQIVLHCKLIDTTRGCQADVFQRLLNDNDKRK